jgi:hypothetical protein
MPIVALEVLLESPQRGGGPPLTLSAAVVAQADYLLGVPVGHAVRSVAESDSRSSDVRLGLADCPIVMLASATKPGA